MSDELVGTGRSGDAIHANLVMGDGETQDFNNVARYWLENGTMTFDAALEKLDAEVAERADINDKLADCVVGIEDGKIKVGVDGVNYVPTPHALRQLATWCDTPHTLINWYSGDKLKQNGNVLFNRDEKDMELIVLALRNGLRRVDEDKDMLFRTYKDGTLRAVLSDRYAIIDNRWYLETLKELLPGGRVSHWNGNADTIYGNVLIPDTIRKEHDSDYGGMLSIGNCEIGLRRLFQYPSVFRAICMNGCIWDHKKGERTTKVHRGKIDLADLRCSILDNLNKQIPLLQSGVDRFLALRSREIPVDTKLSHVFAFIGKENGFSNEQIKSAGELWLQEEKGDRNAFGVINAITRAGQKFDPETWFAFDNVAGNLMNMTDNQWSGLLSNAATMDDEKVSKMFAVAV